MEILIVKDRFPGRGRGRRVVFLCEKEMQRYFSPDFSGCWEAVGACLKTCVFAFVILSISYLFGLFILFGFKDVHHKCFRISVFLVSFFWI